MDTKPDWVPEWVWSEYLSFVRKYSRWAKLPGDSSKTGTRMLEIARLVIFDKNCAVIWPALERRSEVAQSTWIELNKGLPEYVRRGDPHQIISLLTEVALAARGPSPDEVIPATARKLKGERIARLASELRREVTSIIPDGNCPRIFFNAYGDTADSVCDDVVETCKLLTERIENSAPPSEELEEVRFAGRNGFLYGISGDFPALVAIEQAAIAWSQSEPVIYRPNDANASRLYFIRRISNYFRVRYHTPLREATAALTRQIFSCEIDVATITKLSP